MRETERERERATQAMMVLVLDLCLFFGWHSNIKYVFFCSFVLFCLFTIANCHVFFNLLSVENERGRQGERYLWMNWKKLELFGGREREREF